VGQPAEVALYGFALVRQGGLSVVPLTAQDKFFDGRVEADIAPCFEKRAKKNTKRFIV